jgi:hypothetical protein
MSTTQTTNRRRYATWLITRLPFGRAGQAARPRRSRGFPEIWSPMPAVATGARDRDVGREVELLARAVGDVGATTARGLAHLVGARYWGPGRYRRALRAAERQGRIRRIGRGPLGGGLYGPA